MPSKSVCVWAVCTVVCVCVFSHSTTTTTANECNPCSRPQAQPPDSLLQGPSAFWPSFRSWCICPGCQSPIPVCTAECVDCSRGICAAPDRCWSAPLLNRWVQSGLASRCTRCPANRPDPVHHLHQTAWPARHWRASIHKKVGHECQLPAFEMRKCVGTNSANRKAWGQETEQNGMLSNWLRMRRRWRTFWLCGNLSEGGKMQFAVKVKIAMSKVCCLKSAESSSIHARHCCGNWWWCDPKGNEIGDDSISRNWTHWENNRVKTIFFSKLFFEMHLFVFYVHTIIISCCCDERAFCGIFFFVLVYSSPLLFVLITFGN